MSVCVEIEVDDQGQVKVGVDPEQQEQGDKSYMQPAQSVDAALAQAKQLLSGQQQSTSAQAGQQMQAGYARAKGMGGGGMPPPQSGG